MTYPNNSPSISYLLYDFKRWIINEKLKQRLIDSRTARAQNIEWKYVSPNVNLTVLKISFYYGISSSIIAWTFGFECVGLEQNLVFNISTAKILASFLIKGGSYEPYL